MSNDKDEEESTREMKEELESLQQQVHDIPVSQHQLANTPWPTNKNPESRKTAAAQKK